MKNLIEYIFIVISPLVYFISLISPKNNNVHIFGSWFGLKYKDNTKYLFEYYSDNYPELITIWISKDKKIVNNINSEGRQAFSSYSLKGLYYQVIARNFYMTTNSKDFYFAVLSPRNKQFQLWHGTPLKKIGLDSLSALGRVKYKLRSFFIDRYLYVISPFEEMDKNIISAFGISKNQIVRSQNPRCDGMSLSQQVQREIKAEIGFDESYINILYLPTHRCEGNCPEKLNSFIRELVKIEKFLEDINIKIYVKPHFYEQVSFFNTFRSKTVQLIKDDNFDLYELLSVSDAIISDYSSVVFEYSLLNKPIIFFMPDLDEYQVNDRDVYFKPKAISNRFCLNAKMLKKDLTALSQGAYKDSFKLSITENIDLGMISKKLSEKILYNVDN